MSALRVIGDAPRAALVLHPLRLRILEQLREPDSAAGVARRLRVPRQKINYHLRRLEAMGLLALVGERRVGNATQRLLRTTNEGFVLSPRLLGRVAADAKAEPEDAAERLLAATARIERELGRTDGSGDVQCTEIEVTLPDATALQSFARDLAAVARQIASRYTRAAGTGASTHRVVLALHRRAAFHSFLRDPRAPEGPGI